MTAVNNETTQVEVGAPNDIFLTDELRQIVYLLCKSRPLQRIVRLSGDRVGFEFMGNAACVALVADIAMGRDMVPLGLAMSKLRSARNMMRLV